MAGGHSNFFGSRVGAFDNDAPTYSPSSVRDTAAEINVSAGEETANVDIRYRGEPGHIVSGIASGPQSAEPSGFNVILSSTLDGGSQWNSSSYQAPGSRVCVFWSRRGTTTLLLILFSTGEWTLSSPRIKSEGGHYRIEVIPNAWSSFGPRDAGRFESS